jgi:hypothetical protein
MELGPSSGATNWSVTQEFPTFCGTRRFITVFTRAGHYYLSWVRSIRSIPLNVISLRSISISSSHLCQALPSGFPTKTLYIFLLSLFVLHALSISSNSLWQLKELYTLMYRQKATGPRIILWNNFKNVCSSASTSCVLYSYNNFSFGYLQISRKRFILEKLIVAQLVSEYPTII